MAGAINYAGMNCKGNTYTLEKEYLRDEAVALASNGANQEHRSEGLSYLQRNGCVAELLSLATSSPEAPPEVVAGALNTLARMAASGHEEAKRTICYLPSDATPNNLINQRPELFSDLLKFLATEGRMPRSCASSLVEKIAELPTELRMPVLAAIARPDGKPDIGEAGIAAVEALADADADAAFFPENLIQLLLTFADKQTQPKVAQAATDAFLNFAKQHGSRQKLINGFEKLVVAATPELIEALRVLVNHPIEKSLTRGSPRGPTPDGMHAPHQQAQFDSDPEQEPYSPYLGLLFSIAGSPEQPAKLSELAIRKLCYLLSTDSTDQDNLWSHKTTPALGEAIRRLSSCRHVAPEIRGQLVATLANGISYKPFEVIKIAEGLIFSTERRPGSEDLLEDPIRLAAIKCLRKVLDTPISVYRKAVGWDSALACYTEAKNTLRSIRRSRPSDRIPEDLAAAASEALARRGFLANFPSAVVDSVWRGISNLLGRSAA